MPWNWRLHPRANSAHYFVQNDGAKRAGKGAVKSQNRRVNAVLVHRANIGHALPANPDDTLLAKDARNPNPNTPRRLLPRSKCSQIRRQSPQSRRQSPHIQPQNLRPKRPRICRQNRSLERSANSIKSYGIQRICPSMIWTVNIQCSVPSTTTIQTLYIRAQ